MTVHQPQVAMKDSGVAWLGKIPAHWSRQDFWTIAHQVSITGLPNEGLLSVYLDRGVIPYSEGGGLVHKPAESLDDYQLVEPGNFVLNNQQAWRGSVGISRHRGIVSPAYLVFRLSEKILPEYASFLFRTLEFADQMMLSSLSVGDIQRQIKWPYLRKVVVPLPPKEEQVAIARHLDRETDHIDNLIARKTRFIELLAEKRQALITHAVTKGLNSKAKMKDSGVQWLGQVPRHWKAIKVRLLAGKIGSGKTPSGGAEVYVKEGINFLRSQNIYDDGIRLDDVAYITNETHEEMANTKVKPKDVLLNITGGSIGRTSLVPDDFGEANVNQHVCIVRLQNLENAEWVHMAFRASSTKQQIDGLQVGANREGLNFEQVGNLRIALPSPEEMREILVYLKSSIARIDTLIGRTKRSIELLCEHRTALVTAAVTGKIDLRDRT